MAFRQMVQARKDRVGGTVHIDRICLQAELLTIDGERL